VCFVVSLQFVQSALKLPTACTTASDWLSEYSDFSGHRIATCARNVSSFQSRNVYFNSETSSLHQKSELRNAETDGRTDAVFECSAGHHKHEHCADRKADLSSIYSVTRPRCLGRSVLQASPHRGSRLLLQACVAALESPVLLAQVLNHSGCIMAIARCSMVNRAWQAASQQVQLHSVTVMPANGVLTWAEAKRDLKMCKKLGARGMFNQLQSIHICVIKFSKKQVRRYSHIQSLLTIMSAPICKGISTSMLTRCRLSGMFHLISIVQSLPLSLQDLVLEPDHSNSNDGAINLSMFSKFPCLQTLEIDL